ncbi:MAG: DUF2085 domain-containing protein [Anaerolineae bacterium]|nr:DUF2085 domain-containing protein [Anaerolineae bacterium]
MIQVTLFTRQNCKLCDQVHADLESLQEEVPHQLTLVDVDLHPDLQAAYGSRIPVVEVGPYKLEAPIDRMKLHMFLGAARDRAAQKQAGDDPNYAKRLQRGRTLSRSDRITYWFSKNYLAVINIFLFLYVGLPFLAPVLMNAGKPALARPIYSLYGAVCHQMAFRSWFLFGDQPAYPRLSAGVDGLDSYALATGENEADYWAARRYIGSSQVGYKVAYCQRDVAIYAAMLLFGLIYAVTRRRIPALPFILWLLVGIAPIGLDGFSQLLSQYPGFSLWPYRESTPFLRTLTGSLFGLTTAWFGIPLLQESMDEARVFVASKIARLNQSAGS